MDINTVVDQYVKDWRGKFIDQDGYYGSQCWDVVGKFAIQYLGVPGLPTVSGGAEGLFRLAGGPILQYFDRVTSGYKKGDIIVWGSDFFPPWGHTALCLGFDGTTLTVLEQNGANDPNGDGNADGVSYVTTRSLYKVAGALRFKGATAMLNEQDVQNLVYEIWGVPANANNIKDLTGVDPVRAIYFLVNRGTPWGDRYDILNNRYPQLVKDSADWLSVANTRGVNFDKITDALGIPHNANETIVTNAILAKIKSYQELGTQLSTANSAIQQLTAQITELNKRPSTAELEALKKTAADASEAAKKAQAELEKKQADDAAANVQAESLWRAILRKLGIIK